MNDVDGIHAAARALQTAQRMKGPVLSYPDACGRSWYRSRRESFSGEWINRKSGIGHAGDYGPAAERSAKGMESGRMEKRESPEAGAAAGLSGDGLPGNTAEHSVGGTVKKDEV